jgi:hypothetical protein
LAKLFFGKAVSLTEVQRVVEAPACVESLPKRAADDVAKPKEAEMRD